MFIVAVVAHCPAAGVNRYVCTPLVEVFIDDGVHVPVIEFTELSGNAGGLLFRRSGPIWLNTGVMRVVIWIVIVVVEAH
jgi:hypothetical protein